MTVLHVLKRFTHTCQQLSNLPAGRLYVTSSTLLKESGMSVSRRDAELPEGWVQIYDPIRLHQFDGTPLDACREDICNLSLGQPGLDFLKLCSNIIDTATKHRLDAEKDKAYIFQYGPQTGIYSYRAALSKFLTRRYSDTVRKEDLFLTCGATNGLHLVTSQLLAPRPVIFVEDATFMIALDTFREMPDARVVAVPITSEGIDTPAMEKIAEKEWKQWSADSSNRLTKNRPYWAFLYTMTANHNPTGTNLPRDAAESLVEITKRFGILTLADDVYNLLYYKEGPVPLRLFSIARDLAHGRAKKPVDATKTPDPPLPDVAAKAVATGHVISNGTFSKFLSPGIRVGWIEAPGGIILNLRDRGILLGGGSLNHYMSGVVASALELGLVDKHLDFLVTTLRGRMNTLCDVLQSALPPETGCRLERPVGGYFAWLQLPEGTDATAALKFAEETSKVNAIPGATFVPVDGVEPQRHRNCMRIAISFHNEDRVREGAKALGCALSKFLKL